MAKVAGRFCEVHFAGYDLTGRSNQWEFNTEYISDDATAFLDGVVNSIPDLPTCEVNLTAFLDPATNQSHAALNTPGGYTDKALTILIGNNAAPTIGDPALALLCKQFSYSTPLQTRSAVIANANFKSVNYMPDVNAVVLANTTITNTTIFSTVDGGAATTAGGAAYLQVLTPTTSDSYSVVVQDSADGSSWTTIVTFSANGQTRTGERQSISGTIRRYLRVVATRTGVAGNSFKLAVVLARH